MAADWREALMRSAEFLFSLQEEIRTGLGLEPTAFVLIGSAALGLLITLFLWVALRQGSSETQPGKSDPDPGTTIRPRAEESKKRNRRRGGGGEKKLQRNGLAELGDEAAAAAPIQDPNESPDAATGKPEKVKKNKKKLKAATKEPKTSSLPSERKEQEEVGSWETKVSHREKRQQKKKDKGAGEDSPGGARSSPEPAPVVEEPKISIAPTPAISNPPKNNRANKSTNVVTPATPKKEVLPAVDAAAALPPAVSQVWDDVLSRSLRPDPFSGVSVPVEMPGVPSHTWNSAAPERQKPEPSVWPQDMEGSWTIVDSSHIPVSYHGLSGEPAFIPDLSWACHPPVDDEWSGPNSVSAEPGSDWSAPGEEWGNLEECAGVASHLEEPQESDPEKDRDEAAPPGSGKAKKKKKKKKKAADEAGTAAPGDESTASKVKNPVGTALPRPPEQQDRAPPSAPPARVVPKPVEPEAPPTHADQRRRLHPDLLTTGGAVSPSEKPEDSWESPKQVKKKKARRET